MKVVNCIPQCGSCPQKCQHCWYNHYPVGPEMPKPDGSLVRMNSGHDSNLEKDLVLEVAKRYKRVFFNTMINDLEFPGPVVLTINNAESTHGIHPSVVQRRGNLMFVRIRVNPDNIHIVCMDAISWAGYHVPVILTPTVYIDPSRPRHDNLYRYQLGVWYPTDAFKTRIEKEVQASAGPLVKMANDYDAQCIFYYGAWEAQKTGSCAVMTEGADQCNAKQQ